MTIKISVVADPPDLAAPVYVTGPRGVSLQSVTWNEGLGVYVFTFSDGSTDQVSGAASSGDMTKAVYDTGNAGKVDLAILAEAVAWAGVTGKPATFAPSAHGHAISEITSLQASLDAKLPLSGGMIAGNLTLDTGGRLGIGIAAPARPIHIAGDNTFLRADREHVTHGPAWMLARTESDVVQRSWLFGMTNFAGVTDDFVIHDYGTAVGGVGGDARFVVQKGTGNVGIGTTTPAQALDVQGSIAVTGTVDGRDIAADGALLDAAYAWGDHALAGYLTGVAWGDVTGKPATFAPAAHGHAISEITSLQATLDGKAPLASPALTGVPTAPTATGGSNTTQIATTAFVQSAIGAGGGGDMLKAVYDTGNAGKVDLAILAEAVAWGDVTGKPATFAPSAHGHAISEITSLQATLDGKATAAQGANADTAVAWGDHGAAGYAEIGVAQTFTAAQGTTITALTDGASIATDAALSNAFEVTLAGNRALVNPSNLVAGKTYIWIVHQDATGNRTLSFGSAFLFPGGTAPTLSTAANATDAIIGMAISATEIIAVANLDYQ